MKTFIEIIAELDKLNLKKNTESCGFQFYDGNYQFYYRSHSTGRSLNIYLHDFESKDRLLVYSIDQWFYSCYEFNNHGKILGFQKNGPWVQKVGELMKKYEGEIEIELDRRAKLAKRFEEDRRLAEEQKINKFVKLA